VNNIVGALGAGSGIDTRALIDALANASRAPREALLKKREDANTAQISGLAQASAAISSFSSALDSLISGGTLSTQPTVSDSSVFGARALPGARLGNLSRQLEVTQLAQSQSLASANLANVSAPVGKGDLKLTINGTDFLITIDDNNNNLVGLSRAINNLGAGVTANVLEDSNGARLTLTGPSGAANAFTLEAQAGAEPDLLRFEYNAALTTGMTRAQEAKDAVLKLDGVEVRRLANKFSDLIEGVELDLKTAKPGTIVTLGSSRPTESLKQAINDYVGAYNEVKAQLAELTKPARNGEGGGPLRTNTAIRDLQRQLSRITSTPLASGYTVATLADVGVTTNRDGTLTVDTARLDAAVSRDPDGVEALFNPGQTASNPLVKITSAYGRAKPGTYSVSDLVPGNGVTPASGKIEGVNAVEGGGRLIANLSTKAKGLVIEPLGAVTSATITVDLGLGNLLKNIRDTLTSNTGPLVSSNTRLRAEGSRLTLDRAKLDEDDQELRARMTKQYAVMERQINAYKATQSYLEQQIKQWNGGDDD
jgi:flagellar hook-associated protein 2